MTQIQQLNRRLLGAVLSNSPSLAKEISEQIESLEAQNLALRSALKDLLAKHACHNPADEERPEMIAGYAALKS